MRPQELVAAAPGLRRIRCGCGASQTLGALIAEALQNNPELRAAAKETEAANQRVRPAGALEDPMLEAGLLNVPIQPLRLNREDMTMKMLGLSQKLPYPGKRALREQVAAKDAETLELRPARNQQPRGARGQARLLRSRADRRDRAAAAKAIGRFWSNSCASPRAATPSARRRRPRCSRRRASSAA